MRRIQHCALWGRMNFYAEIEPLNTVLAHRDTVTGWVPQVKSVRATPPCTRKTITKVKHVKLLGVRGGSKYSCFFC